MTLLRLFGGDCVEEGSAGSLFSRSEGDDGAFDCDVGSSNMRRGSCAGADAGADAGVGVLGASPGRSKSVSHDIVEGDRSRLG